MAFNVTADAYGRFMGRYADPLAPQFAELAAVRDGQRVLDVGCGPGALTDVLVDRLGPRSVSAIDPSPPFVAAVHERFPDLDVREGTAEHLPYDDGAFDATLAQLVVHFMRDPAEGVAEMRRVTRSGGVVAACVWDHAGGRGPLSPFWRVVRQVWPQARDESGLYGSRDGQLVELFEAAGLRGVESAELTVRVEYADFDEWWEPYTLGVGPAGDYVSGLDDRRRAELRTRCAEEIPTGPFTVSATAWTVLARP